MRILRSAVKKILFKQKEGLQKNLDPGMSFVICFQSEKLITDFYFLLLLTKGWNLLSCVIRVLTLDYVRHADENETFETGTFC